MAQQPWKESGLNMVSNSFTYRLSITAEADIDEIIDYIALILKNPIAAKSLYDQLIKILQHLCEMPKIGHIVENEFDRRDDVRWLPINNYILYYVVNNEDRIINVLRVVSARRDQHLIINSIIK